MQFLGHIISDIPGVTGSFGSFKFRQPHPGGTTQSDQFQACVHPLSPQPSWGYLCSLCTSTFKHPTSPSRPALRISHSSSHCLLTPSPPFSFNKNTCLDVSESRTMFGLKLFSTMFPRNLSCFPRSTISCQSFAVSKRPVQAFSREGPPQPPSVPGPAAEDVLQSSSCLAQGTCQSFDPIGHDDLNHVEVVVSSNGKNKAEWTRVVVVAKTV